MKVLVTGADGFIAQNLILKLKELKSYEVLSFTRKHNSQDLQNLTEQADFVFHLAGVNRPQNTEEFNTGNVSLTETLASAVKLNPKKIPVVFSSSAQAELNNPYGKSKKAAEDHLLALNAQHFVNVYRLPNVFGKWAKPNYNSAVATFSYNIVNNLPIIIHDAAALINLVYVDDVVEAFVQNLKDYEASKNILNRSGRAEVKTVYKVSVGELAEKLNKFKVGRESLMTEPVGIGLDRALYSTFISYYRPEQFGYNLKRYSDPRGVFVEFLKTKDSGQFSFFTAGVGITRGGHYHHTKTEKFLILQGKARFRFRHMLTGERHELTVTGEESRVIETIPGWTHDISNVGDQELIVMLWASEIFDRQKPDTIGCEV